MTEQRRLVNNEEVLAEGNVARGMLNTRRDHKHGELLCNLVEERMVGKPTKGRRMIQMLDVYENNGYEALKTTTEDMKEKQ